MTATAGLEQLFCELQQSGVRLWLEGERLRYSARRGALSQHLIARMSERKGDIIAMLRSNDETRVWPTGEASPPLVEAAPPRLQRVPREREPPLSFAQQRLWFLDQLAPGSSFYNVPLAIPLSVPADVAVLQRSLDEIVRRHESLRTTFAMGKHGEPGQVIAPSLQVPLAIHDLRDLPPDRRDSEVVRLLTEEALRPFDLATGPVVRFGLLRSGAASDVFMLTMHHIVADAWSLQVFGQELAAIYSAFAIGRPSPLRELAIQYADFAVWQRAYLTGRVLEEQLAYWEDQLAGLSTLRLPTDYERPAVQAHRGALQPVTLTARTAAAVRAVAHANAATPFMALLAAFAVVLRRYTDQDDLAIGTAVAGRNRGELEPLIGFFVNSLVLRVDTSGDPTFAELVDRVRRTALGAYAHQDVPFEMLVEKLARSRDASRNPLFQITFQVVNTAQIGVTPTAVQPAEMNEPGPEIHRGTAIFDLAFTLVDEPHGFRGGIEYNTDLFEPETIRRMVEHFQIAVEAVMSQPGLRVSEVPLLSADEYYRLVVEWNNTANQVPDQQPTTLHEWYARQVRSWPTAPAIVSADGEIAFGALEHRAQWLAARLTASGVGRGDIVGIAMHRCIESAVCMLATLKAGAAYLPLDPDYPTKRLDFMLVDSRARALLTDESLKSVLSTDEWTAVSLDQGAADLEYGAARSLNLHIRSAAHDTTSSGVQRAQQSDVAYVIYTSGSTGTPKGVCVSHSAICNHMAWLLGTFSMKRDDRILQRTAFGFDASVWEWWAPLLSGALLVLPPSRLQRDIAKLAQHIAEQRITVLQVVPSMLRLLLDEPGFAFCRSLRHVFCGGEILTAESARRLVAMMPSVHLHNLYGPTEATIDSTCWTYRANDEFDERRFGTRSGMPIGRPIWNVRTYVLDERLQPLPVGVPGELYVGGAGLARGYLGRPELTAERFIDDPFVGGARMYRTGDRARWCSDGNLEFLGRSDHQVKIRGYRIEPGEIEAALLRHAAVREAVVVARDHGEDKRLVAYVARANNRDAVGILGGATSNNDTADKLLVASLRQALAQELPDYMIPSTFVVVNALPLTPSGKVDRQALPTSDVVAQSPYEAPRAPVEEVLAKLWARLLDVTRVGVHDDFFADLGGHSLLAVRLMARVRDLFQMDLPLRTLFEAPTVAGMAATLLGADADQGHVEKVAQTWLSLERMSDDEVDAMLSAEVLPVAKVSLAAIHNGSPEAL